MEQKNWLSVRRRIGYDRYSSPGAHVVFQPRRAGLEREGNFFRPLRKLVSKERVGAKVVKRYDTPRTPYERVLAAGILTEEERQALEQAFLALNPVQLQAGIQRLLRQLPNPRNGVWSLATRPEGLKGQKVG